MNLKSLVAIVILSVTVMLTSCTPHQIALYKTLSPTEQEAVNAALRQRNAPTDCYGAIDRYWPSESRAWAKKIVHRESRNNPRAQNSRSTSAGCLQLIKAHAPRFERVGCSWAERYDAACNIKAGLDLYREAGTRPWRL